MFEMSDQKQAEILDVLQLLKDEVFGLPAASDNRSARILELEAEVEKLQAKWEVELAKIATDMVAAVATIAFKDARILKLEALAGRLERGIQDAEADVADRDRQIRDLRDSINDRDATILVLRNKISPLDSRHDGR